MADRYAPIWFGTDVLDRAGNIGISECFDCDLEWNDVRDGTDKQGVDDTRCPECGKTATVVRF